MITINEAKLDDIKAKRLAGIKAESQRRADAYMSTYPDFEKLTWGSQESEARAYLEDETTPTPTLTPISTARGVPLNILAVKVIEKADAFRTVAAILMGQRQAMEDQVMTATTVTEVLSINWPEEA